ncbi:MAG: chloride channel protein [Isosphaeraceae bacterium]
MSEPSRRIGGTWPALGRVLNQLATRWATPGGGRVMVCSPLIGVIAGLGAVAFLLSLEATSHLFLARTLHFQPPPTGEGYRHGVTYPSPLWLIPVVTTFGGLVSGLLVFTFAPEAEGHGTDALIRAFHRNSGQIRTRVPIVKGLASIITIGTGGSAGQEGPIAQIGAGFGSFFARLLRLSTDERRLMMLAGAAGGIGAVFRAPLGGALFAGEVLYATTASEATALLPCLASSIVAYSTFALFITPKPIFQVPSISFHGFAELPLFAAMAVACAGVGCLYVKVFYGVRDHVFQPLPIPRTLKPALGGLAVGLMAMVVPEILGGGYGWVQWGAIGMPPNLAMEGVTPFQPAMGLNALFMLALLKIVATSLTISSGGSGGVFGPSVFIGGMLGGAFGQLVAALFPDMRVDPAAFALVGMGGFFAGVSMTPLASMVMVCEMAGSYSLLVPLMLVCTLNLGLSRRWTLYEEQVPSPVDSPAHLGDFVVDVLERIRVGQVKVRTEGVERVNRSRRFDEILHLAAESTETIFPVVNDAGGLVGIFSLRDVRQALAGSHVGPLVLADDIATRPVATVNPGDDLHTALRRLTERNLDEIPVVSPDDPTRLLGLLSRRDLVAAYSEQIQKLRSPGP